MNRRNYTLLHKKDKKLNQRRLLGNGSIHSYRKHKKSDFISFSIQIPTVFLNYNFFFRMPNAQPLPRMAQLKSPKTNRPAKNWKQINLKPSRLQLFEIAPRNASIILKHSYIFWTSLVRRKRLKTKKIWALFKRRIFHIFFFVSYWPELTKYNNFVWKTNI